LVKDIIHLGRHGITHGLFAWVKHRIKLKLAVPEITDTTERWSKSCRVKQIKNRPEKLNFREQSCSAKYGRNEY
jgi:hypothetical protein